jgi:hypothetical protein
MLAGIPACIDSAGGSTPRVQTSALQNQSSLQPNLGPIWSKHILILCSVFSFWETIRSFVTTLAGVTPFDPQPSWRGLVSVQHRVAVDPAVYPAAANMVRPLPQQTMSMLTGGPNRDRAGQDRHQSHHTGGPDGKGSKANIGSATWPSILSSECQKRHFNPQFKEWSNRDGTYQCSVSLKGINMNDSRTWENPTDAKNALAKRAVALVRDMPVHNNFYQGGQEKTSSKNEDRNKKQGTTRDLEEERRLLMRIQTLYGHNSGPSHQVMADAVAAHAFLEGFALGSKLRDASRDVRRRSRSPVRGGRNVGR